MSTTRRLTFSRLAPLAAAAAAVGTAGSAMALDYHWDFGQSNDNPLTDDTLALSAGGGGIDGWELEADGMRFQEADAAGSNWVSFALLAELDEYDFIADQIDFRMESNITAHDMGERGTHRIRAMALAEDDFDPDEFPEGTWIGAAHRPVLDDEHFRLVNWHPDESPQWTVGDAVDWEGETGEHVSTAYNLVLEGEFQPNGDLTLTSTLEDDSHVDTISYTFDAADLPDGYRFGIGGRADESRDDFDITIHDLSIVPEPGSLALLGAGAGLMLIRRRK